MSVFDSDPGLFRMGGLAFCGGDQQVVDGFTLESVGGWTETPEKTRPTAKRPQQVGMYDLPGHFEDRLVSLAGLILGSSPSKLGHLVSSLNGLGWEDAKQTLVADYLGLTQWVSGRIQGVRATPVGPGVFRYLLRVYCADSRKYGETRVFSASPVFHYGNMGALPVFEITGTYPGVTITGPEGRQIVITQPLTAGQSHRFDMRTGRLYRRVGAGAWELQTAAVSKAELWVVPPGRPVTVAFSAGAGATTVTETWI